MKHSLELTEVIKQLRKDLTLAANYAEGEAIRVLARASSGEH